MCVCVCVCVCVHMLTDDCTEVIHTHTRRQQFQEISDSISEVVQFSHHSKVTQLEQKIDVLVLTRYQLGKKTTESK